MGLKKFEDMDHYEILNVKQSASQQEIQRAYSIGISAYSYDSMAHYAILSEEERKEMLRKIEKAFSILGNPDLRWEYDRETLHKSQDSTGKAYFRRSTERMIIEDAGTGQQWIEHLKRFLVSPKKQ